MVRRLRLEVLTRPVCTSFFSTALIKPSDRPDRRAISRWEIACGVSLRCSSTARSLAVKLSFVVISDFLGYRRGRSCNSSERMYKVSETAGSISPKLTILTFITALVQELNVQEVNVFMTRRVKGQWKNEGLEMPLTRGNTNRSVHPLNICAA